MKPRDIAHGIRSIVSRAVVRGTNDGGEMQTADVTTHASVDRSGVEIVQPFGVASRPRSGGLMVVLAVGGDQGDLVGLPIGLPEDRLGGLEEGEAAIYAADGSRVHVKADGTVDVNAQAKVNVNVNGTTFVIEEGKITSTVEGTRLTQSAEGFAFVGGTITHDGVPIDKDHKHEDVTPGSALTGVPTG